MENLVTGLAGLPKPLRYGLPILMAAVLAFGLAIVGAGLAYGVILLLHLPIKPGDNTGWLYLQHASQLLVGLGLIFLFKRYWVPANYGLQLPPGKSYLLPAVLWGLFFGLLMTVVDYLPQLMSHTAPKLDYPLTTGNIAAWLGFEWLYVGPTEEIPFRALLVTFLMATLPGKVRLGRYEMHMAGVIVALLFALLHATNFSSRHWAAALGQQFYAFALGVLYAYWLEKSRSILASAVSHNVGDGVEYTLIFLMAACWPAAQA